MLSLPLPSRFTQERDQTTFEPCDWPRPYSDLNKAGRAFESAPNRSSEPCEVMVTQHPQHTMKILADRDREVAECKQML